MILRWVITRALRRLNSFKRSDVVREISHFNEFKMTETRYRAP